MLTPGCCRACLTTYDGAKIEEPFYGPLNALKWACLRTLCNVPLCTDMGLINYSSTQHSEERKGNSRSKNESMFNCNMFDFPCWMSFLFSRWKCHTLHRSPCILSPPLHALGCSHQHRSLTHEGLRPGIWSMVLPNCFGRTDWSCCKIHHKSSWVIKPRSAGFSHASFFC